MKTIQKVETNSKGQTYKEWMREVDFYVSCKIGLSVHDLPDFCSRDCFEGDMTPKEAAEVAFEEADMGDELLSILLED